MMEHANYRPVLPDESVAIDLGAGNMQHGNHIRAREAVSLSKNKTVAEQPNIVNAKKTAEKKVPIKLSNNKVLTIGLIIIVVILIIVIVIQILRHRKSADSENTQQHQIDGGDAPQIEPPEKNNSNMPAIDDNMLQQYMKKAQPVKDRRTAMASHKANRTEHADNQRLQSIVEENANMPDSEYGKMRENIGQLLKQQKSDEDDAMGMGSDAIVEAHGAMETDSDQEVDQQLDEALVNQVDDVDTDSGTCKFVLVAGQRSGQHCERKCGDSDNRCTRHIGK